MTNSDLTVELSKTTVRRASAIPVSCTENVAFAERIGLDTAEIDRFGETPSATVVRTLN